MGLDSIWHSLNMTLQVSFIDLLLSGDNAIVIALACRNLPVKQMRQAIFIGTGVGIGLRILFTSMVTLLLQFPGLKLLGMAALIVIAIQLLIDEDHDGLNPTPADLDGSQPPVSLWPTLSVIVSADLAMSLDNVVALAAVTQNSLFFLLLGLALSVPLLMYGSLFVTGLLKRYPLLIPAGGALLGWVAGDIGTSDPWIADWIASQAPALTLALPLACAIFVLLESRIIQKNLERFPPPVLRTAGAAHALPVQQSVVHAVTAPLPGRIDSSDHGSTPPTVPTEPGRATPLVFTRAGLPYLLIPLFAVPVLAVIGSIVYKGLLNDGLMPKPGSLVRYECPGSNGPYSFYFQHGRDHVQIRSNAGMLDGKLHDGKIEWINFAGGTSLLGFSPPTEITYDDAKSVRVNGGSALQVNCSNAQKSPAAQ